LGQVQAVKAAAHHLGYRLRNLTGPQARQHVRNLGDPHAQVWAAKASGAWSIHPVKSLEAIREPLDD
jgi:hypothetical protein